MMMDDIRVIIEKGSFTEEDAAYYIEKLKHTSKFSLKKVTFHRSDDHLDIRCAYKEIPFERIRRIPLSSSQERRAVNH